MRRAFPIGKVPPRELERLLRMAERRDRRVVVGPRLGEDAAALSFGETLLLAKSDPVTFTETRAGWYVVQVNANDIAVMGGQPRWFLLTILLPEGRTTRRVVEEIQKDVCKACGELGVTLIGGHAEITAGLARPILCGTMLGEVRRGRLVRSTGARDGDHVLLVRGAAIEGTSILARERSGEIERRFGRAFQRRCARLLFDPGISVVRDALLACRAAVPHAMHDPTEGGILAGLWEMARAAGCGIHVEGDAVPVLPETEALSGLFGLDPLGLIASGALLVALAGREAAKLESAFTKKGIPCRAIGRMRKASEGFWIVRNGRRRPLRPPSADEITKALPASAEERQI